MKNTPPEYKLWLTKAWHDLRSAQLLMNCEDPIWDTAVYHCQQAAEKSLKALLAYWDESIPRTHDITLLVERCIDRDVSFEQWREAAEEITPYATFFRYPGDLLEPDPQDARHALDTTEKLYGFIIDYLNQHG